MLLFIALCLCVTSVDASICEYVEVHERASERASEREMYDVHMHTCIHIKSTNVNTSSPSSNSLAHAPFVRCMCVCTGGYIARGCCR
jgi:hypothetical protein